MAETETALVSGDAPNAPPPALGSEVKRTVARFEYEVAGLICGCGDPLAAPRANDAPTLTPSEPWPDESVCCCAVMSIIDESAIADCAGPKLGDSSDGCAWALPPPPEPDAAAGRKCGLTTTVGCDPLVPAELGVCRCWRCAAAVAGLGGGGVSAAMRFAIAL